ncbi:MAG: cyclic nucleotide-binding domain-containing protein [Deltaproteobacteria bacterium]|nr:cyclic nucleotide-binding domain-containing protein [Deltaproteobacteria bacterium]
MHSEYLADLELLLGLPVYNGVPMEAMKLLSYLCVRESFKPGEIIFHQHEVDSHAYCLVEGRATVHLENNPQAVLRRFGPVDFIGGLSLFCEAGRLFTLKAETRAVLLMLSREKFLKILEQFPSAGPAIFQNLAKRIHYWEQDYVSRCENRHPQCLTGLGVTLL